MSITIAETISCAYYPPHFLIYSIFISCDSFQICLQKSPQKRKVQEEEQVISLEPQVISLSCILFYIRTTRCHLKLPAVFETCQIVMCNELATNSCFRWKGPFLEAKYTKNK